MDIRNPSVPVEVLRNLINFCHKVRAISFTDSRFSMEEEQIYIGKYLRGT